jgi:hypothetical protein
VSRSWLYRQPQLLAEIERLRQPRPEALSANPRYKLINEQIFAPRGEDLYIAIEGVKRLSTQADNHRRVLINLDKIITSLDARRRPIDDDDG